MSKSKNLFVNQGLKNKGATGRMWETPSVNGPNCLYDKATYRPPTHKPCPKTLAAVPIKAHELTGRRRRRQRGGRNRSRAMGSDTESEQKRAPVALAPIAKPLAGKKLCKRTLKLVRRGLEDCYTPFAVGFMVISPCLYTIISILFCSLWGQMLEARSQGGR